MMGADSSTSTGGGISLTSSNVDKIAVIHDGNVASSDSGREFFDLRRESLEQQAIAAGFAGDVGDGEQTCISNCHRTSSHSSNATAFHSSNS